VSEPQPAEVDDAVDNWLRAAVVAVTLLAVGLFVARVGGPALMGAMVPFVLLCPGLAWARHLRGDLGETVGFGIGLSIALAAVVGEVMALVSWWSPGTGLAVLVTLTAVGLALPRRARADDDAPEGA